MVTAADDELSKYTTIAMRTPPRRLRNKICRSREIKMHMMSPRHTGTEMHEVQNRRASMLLKEASFALFLVDVNFEVHMLGRAAVF
jgi:hypothetical protein